MSTAFRKRASAALTSRWAKPVVFVLALLPMGWAVWLAAGGGLGAEPIAEGVRQTGLWALRFLLIALAVTPLRVLTGLPALARFRRMIGLFAFFTSETGRTITLLCCGGLILLAIVGAISERGMRSAR